MTDDELLASVMRKLLANNGLPGYFALYSTSMTVDASVEDLTSEEVAALHRVKPSMWNMREPYAEM